MIRSDRASGHSLRTRRAASCHHIPGPRSTGVEPRDPALGLAAVGRPRCVLRERGGGDGTKARGARSVGRRTGRSHLPPRPAARRAGRTDGSRLPHGADDRRLALDAPGGRNPRRERRPRATHCHSCAGSRISPSSTVAPASTPDWAPAGREASSRRWGCRCRRTASAWSGWPRPRASPAPSSTTAGRRGGSPHPHRRRPARARTRRSASDPPRRWVEDILDLAGRYADHIDLAPPPREARTSSSGRSSRPPKSWSRRRTRPRSGSRDLTASILLSALVVCDADSVEQEEAALCARVGLSPAPSSDCPYVLIGPPERLAERVRELRERIGLDWLIVPLSAVDRFASGVMPLLA